MQSPLRAANPGPKRKPLEQQLVAQAASSPSSISATSPGWSSNVATVSPGPGSACTAEDAPCWDAQHPQGHGPEGPQTPVFATKTAAPHARDHPQGAATLGASAKVPWGWIWGPAEPSPCRVSPPLGYTRAGTAREQLSSTPHCSEAVRVPQDPPSATTMSLGLDTIPQQSKQGCGKGERNQEWSSPRPGRRFERSKGTGNTLGKCLETNPPGLSHPPAVGVTLVPLRTPATPTLGLIF